MFTTEVPRAAPLLTVAMSVLNGGKHLSLAVESIVNQSFRDWELLIIDDGSSDGSIERLRQLSDPRIRVVRDGLNKGLATRLNEAVELARGTFFARMDHDDIAHPERFSRQLSVLNADPKLDLLSTQCLTISESNEIVGILPSAQSNEEICHAPWRGFYMPHPTWMGRLEWFRTHRYAEPGPYRCEDQDLLLRSFEQSKFAACAEILLAYRVRDRLTWSVAIRTRLALNAVQRQYFLQRREFGRLFLSIGVTFLRVVCDFLQVGKQKVFCAAGAVAAFGCSLPPSEFLYWQSLIGQLQERDNLACRD